MPSVRGTILPSTNQTRHHPDQLTQRAAGAVDLGITFELGPAEVARIDVSVPIQSL